MAPPEKIFRAVFFRSAGGDEPVRDWLLDNLSSEDRKRIGVDVATVEFGWPVGPPLSKPLIHGLREVRTTLAGGRIARVIFAIEGDQMLLLHGFIKKSRRTPARELDTALRRLKEARK